ncbi:hypothetical protein FG476_04655 [Xylella fastidiosa subsp. multiplex]|uniref:Uncharacterized protein n=1 Tax=Xylella fastidiosa subsp. multiplex TaxID=644357 RepID=A0A9Q4QSV1_XYLFS|nr:conserved hypothetical protein [Xylella fastidiosa M12]MBE0269221.1 hypothetical protein [Xylella fastidiosa subsp. multiplex]TNV88720.1 hypothetical protein C5H23_09570 [Xylella fastidiosa]MBE0275929.1 hypothetical protein [Xylella fastidiosa subsp. multiplex]MBE0278156.1 hypothetical protein [Xylella fastidiosa subsp. multiplex]
MMGFSWLVFTALTAFHAIAVSSTASFDVYYIELDGSPCDVGAKLLSVPDLVWWVRQLMLVY